MFVALRDLRFARGRFALMGAVVALITALVTVLSGLTGGLARANASAVEALPADRIVFAAPPGPDGRRAAASFDDSRVTARTLEEWRRVPGVTAAEPLGVAMNRVAAASGRGEGAAVFGVEPGGALARASGGAPAPGAVVLSAALAADTGLRAGDRVRVGDRTLAVAGVGADASYGHAPVAWVALDDWHALSGGAFATVLAVSATGRADLAAADRRLGTTALTPGDARAAIGSFTAENGSLQLMRAFLFTISALVIGAFFTVWTIQRRTDVAVLKALGASTGYLLRDALAQAVAVLLAGAALGGGLGALLGALAGDAAPFALSAAIVVPPVAVLVLLGAAGAAAALRPIVSADPLTALGAAR
ncbi:ABC transporter permease [Actinomadura atramentaria]|uniref:ABC transporter permease n=1 Tax=Actinomadura atramentaria TaxID=1990 RepID=UPI000362C36E|nr:ABC transporter permease [Actinomadura atramentaria]